MPLPASRQIASVDSTSPGAGGDAGRGMEGAAAAGGETEAVARHEGGGAGLRVHAQLLLRLRVGHQPLRLVVVGEEAHQPAVLDQVGAAGGKPLAGYPLAADEPGGGAVVADAELLRGDLLGHLPHARRTRRVEHPRAQPRQDDVVQDLHRRLTAEDDPVLAAGQADAAHGAGGGLRRLPPPLVRVLSSPLTMGPGSPSFSGRSTRLPSDSEVWKTRRAPFTTRQPVSTRSASLMSSTFGSW